MTQKGQPVTAGQLPGCVWLFSARTESSQEVPQTRKENLPITGRRWEGFAFPTPDIATGGGPAVRDKLSYA
jgi:hypothetical protein